MKEFLFVEKYRPSVIDDCILPPALEKVFKSFLNAGDIQNMLLYGQPGSGKTTVAKALANELGADYMFLNASNENSIDVLRTKLTNFVTTGSLIAGGKRKIVILDEADNMTAAFMSALKAFIEEFSSNVAFILTANLVNKIIDPLRSRLLNIEFNLPDNPQYVMSHYMKRLMWILDTENIKYEKPVLAKLIKQFFPDFRRILNEVQKYSIGGVIDSGIFANIKDIDIDIVLDFMKDGDWKSMREYFDTHADSINSSDLVGDLYRVVDKYFEPASIPEVILLIDDYMTASFYSVNKKISMIALMTRIMVEGVFKK